MIQLYRKDLNLSGVAYQSDVIEVTQEGWEVIEQQCYINKKLATQIYNEYFYIKDEKTAVYKLLNKDQQDNLNEDKEQFLILKILDEKTSSSYFGVFLEHNFKDQFKKALPFSTFLIEQFNEQLKNWNQGQQSFIEFQNLGEAFNVHYLESTVQIQFNLQFLLQKKLTPLQINIKLDKQEVSVNEQFDNLYRKIFNLNQEKDKIEHLQQEQENKLKQYVDTEQKLLIAQSSIQDLQTQIQMLEQFSQELYHQNKILIEKVNLLESTKRSQESQLAEVFKQNYEFLSKFEQKELPHVQKLNLNLQRIDENLYQSNQYKLEENKPLEFSFLLKDTDQIFKLAITDFEEDSYYDVQNEDFTVKFEYPSGIYYNGDIESQAYTHPFGADDLIRFVILDDGNRKTLQYSINGVEKPALKLHGSLSSFYVVVKFDNDNIPLENYLEFKA